MSVKFLNFAMYWSKSTVLAILETWNFAQTWPLTNNFQTSSSIKSFTCFKVIECGSILSKIPIVVKVYVDISSSKCQLKVQTFDWNTLSKLFNSVFASDYYNCNMCLLSINSTFAIQSTRGQVHIFMYVNQRCWKPRKGKN